MLDRAERMLFHRHQPQAPEIDHRPLDAPLRTHRNCPLPPFQRQGADLDLPVFLPGPCAGDLAAQFARPDSITKVFPAEPLSQAKSSQTSYRPEDGTATVQTARSCGLDHQPRLPNCFSSTSDGP